MSNWNTDLRKAPPNMTLLVTRKLTIPFTDTARYMPNLDVWTDITESFTYDNVIAWMELPEPYDPNEVEDE